MQGFVHPALAFGALLAVVPLIIHLLNRRRHKPLRWGAMRFVEAAYKRTRRRMQLENLLLLLMRMLAVAALAFAVARPFAGRGALGALTESSRDMVLLLDASASTGYREDIDTVFDRIVRRAESLVGELNASGTDRVHVLLLADDARLIAWPTPEKALSVLTTLDNPNDTPLNLNAAFAEVERLVTDGEILDLSRTEVRLLTDLQRNSFAGSIEDSGTPAYFDRLDALEAQGLKVWVEDLGPASTTPANLSVQSIQLDGGGRGPKEASVTVYNHSNQPQPGVRVSLDLDGNRLPSQRVDLEPRAQAQVSFPLGVMDPGPHSLVGATEGDRLIADDSRASVALVPEPTRVLLVNGSPAEDIVQDGVGYLRLALEQEGSGDLLSPFDVTTLRAGELSRPDLSLDGYDVIWLAGMPAPSQEWVQRIEEKVLEGAALVISAGPQMGDLQGYNERLFRADGTGLLPGEMLRQVSIARQGDFYRIERFQEDHPALELFADASTRPLLIGVPFSDFVALGVEPTARVLASLDDQGQSPLLVEKPLGRGKVMFFASSINEDWTLLPRAGPTFVPFAYELLTYAAGATIGERAVSPGQPITIEVDGFPRTPELERPDGSRRVLDGDPAALGGERYALPTIPDRDTRQTGLYQVHLDGSPSQPFAVVLDPAESDLTRLTGGELTTLHTAFQLEASTQTNTGGYQDGRNGEIWRILAMLALACLVGESLWGAYLGRKRSVA